MCKPIITIISILCLFLVFQAAATASVECVADGNDTAATATPIGYTDTVTDVVCPDIDPFDYYTFTIPAGADVSGDITFDSAQTGTTIKASGPGGDIFNTATSDASHTLHLTLPAVSIPAGVYYIRIGFYSTYPTNHEYTLTLNLTVTTSSECVPDDNEDAAHAVALSFGSTVSDWVCTDDHLDVWHFTVASVTQGTGKITLTADPGELILYVFDSASTELYRGTTSSGTLEYTLGAAASPLANGDYYIGVLLPLARDDENSYTVGLTEGTPVVMMELHHPSLTPIVTTLPKSTWPLRRGNPQKNGRSNFNGPSGSFSKIKNFNILHDLGLVTMGAGIGDSFEELVAGINNKVYFLDPYTATLYAYNALSGKLWDYPVGGVPPFLDEFGRIYTTQRDGEQVVSLDADGNVLWSRRISGEGSLNIQMVGKRVHVSLNTGTSGLLYVYEKTGDLAWTSAPFPKPIYAAAEDKPGNVYIITAEKIYKYDTSGHNLWSQQYTTAPAGIPIPVIGLPGTMPGLPGIPPAISQPILGPVIGGDNRVWINSYNSLKYFIYYSDGSTYENGIFPNANTTPVAVCTSADDHLFTATKDGNVVFYDNWTHETWRTPVAVGGNIHDLIMGADGKLYVAYSQAAAPGSPTCEYSIAQLNPDNGSIAFTVVAGEIPSDSVQGVINLAIGESGQLICLNHTGGLSVFALTFTAIPHGGLSISGRS